MNGNDSEKEFNNLMSVKEQLNKLEAKIRAKAKPEELAQADKSHKVWHQSEKQMVTKNRKKKA